MKKVIKFISVIAIGIFALMGCTSEDSISDKIDRKEYETDNHETDNLLEKDDSDAFIEEAGDTGDVEVTENRYLFYSDYKENYAWVKYECNENVYWAVIDKEGKMLFRYDAGSIVSVVPYSGGYAYITYEDSLMVIDTLGNVTSSYAMEKNNSVIAYGDGYVLTEQYRADFDIAEYIYTIYDFSGKEIVVFSCRKALKDYQYCGKGVFYFTGWSVKDESKLFSTFYCVSTDKWVEYSASTKINFRENISVVGLDMCDPDEVGYRAKLVLMDDKGQLQEKELYPEDGWSWVEDTLIVDESVCILYEYGKGLSTYDLAEGVTARLDSYYADKVIWDLLPDPLVFDSGKIVLRLRGSDEKVYIAAFDKNWNAVIGPVLASSSRYSEDMLIILEEDGPCVYNGNGEKIFNLYEKEFSHISAFSNGVARVSNWVYEGDPFIDDSEIYYSDFRIPGDMPSYLDKSGNLLFNQIDTGNVIDK